MHAQDFDRLAAAGFNRIPVVQELLADLDSPLSIYLKLANRPYSYLMESVVGGERHGRYSIVGLPADTRLRVNGHRVQVECGDKVIERHDGDPLAFIEAFQHRFRIPELPGLPRYSGGLVGYFGYDTIRYVEKRLADTQKPDPVGTPDILLMLSEEIAVVDNLSGKLYLVVYADPEVPNALQKAQARLAQLRAMLREPLAIPLSLP
ncbi:anthranilate synthase component I, partial [Chromobacterium piscinae]